MERDYSKTRVDRISFADAIDKASAGWVIARQGWPNGQIVFQAREGTFTATDLITATMQPFMVMRTEHHNYIPYVPSHADMTSSDWAAMTRQTYARQVRETELPREQMLRARPPVITPEIEDYSADQRIDP